MRTERRLTSFSHGAGCGCKLGPEQLRQVLGGLTLPGLPPDVLVAADTGDDAAVVRARRRPRARRHARLLHPDRRRPVRLGTHRRHERDERRLRDGRHAVPRAQHRELAGRRPAARHAGAGAAGRHRRGDGRGLPGARGPFDHRPRAEVRHGRARLRRPGPHAAELHRGRRRLARAHQAARPRHDLDRRSSAASPPTSSWPPPSRS